MSVITEDELNSVYEKGQKYARAERMKYEKNVYFFKYPGYGGDCYVVKAYSMKDAGSKLKEMLLLTKNYNNGEIDSIVRSCYLLRFVDDIAETFYLGE